MRKLQILLLLSFVLLPACYDEIHCKDTEQCGGGAGIPAICLSDMRGNFYCAEPFLGCPTKYRWARGAAEDLIHKCVRPEYLPMDGGVDGQTAD